MSSLFGSTTNPTPSTPIVGQNTQGSFFNALYGMGLTKNPNDGTMMFNSMPAYQGQLTPDLNSMMSSNVWNSWSPQAPGMGQLQGMMTGIQNQIGQVSPYLQPYIDSNQVSYPMAMQPHTQVPVMQGPRGSRSPGQGPVLSPIGPRVGSFT